MARLDRHPNAKTERVERPVEPVDVDLEARRKLKQDRPESIAEDRRTVHQVLDRRPRIVEPLDVRQVATRLHREHEPVGHRVAPAAERRGRRHPVERHVQLDRIEVLGVERQPVTRLDEPGIERPTPVAVVEPEVPTRIAMSVEVRADAHYARDLLTRRTVSAARREEWLQTDRLFCLTSWKHGG